ncbi:MAG: hypothetical protein LBH43_02390 [Treponema sp.]|nr:hypothetical protein [Treponema sp.]
MTTAFVVLQPAGAAAFPWLVFMTPTVLFPLMALFLWLDISRYRVYLPLFMAGKGIGIFSLLGWSIVSRKVIMTGGFSGGVIEWILLSGDVFTIAVVLFIIKDMHISDMYIRDMQSLPEVPAGDSGVQIVEDD